MAYGRHITPNEAFLSGLVPMNYVQNNVRTVTISMNMHESKMHTIYFYHLFPTVLHVFIFWAYSFYRALHCIQHPYILQQLTRSISRLLRRLRADFCSAAAAQTLHVLLAWRLGVLWVLFPPKPFLLKLLCWLCVFVCALLILNFIFPLAWTTGFLTSLQPKDVDTPANTGLDQLQEGDLISLKPLWSHHWIDGWMDDWINGWLSEWWMDQ